MIASPFLPKYLSSPRCASLHGALYLIGDNTKKVYVYDPGANLWQKVGPTAHHGLSRGRPGQGVGRPVLGGSSFRGRPQEGSLASGAVSRGGDS